MYLRCQSLDYLGKSGQAAFSISKAAVDENTMEVFKCILHTWKETDISTLGWHLLCQ